MYRKKVNLMVLAITLLSSTIHGKVEQEERFSEKVGVVALAVKDTVTDTADTVRRSVRAGAEAAKSFIASAAEQVQVRLQEARAKQAQEKAEAARRKKEEMEKELAVMQEQLRLTQAALAQARAAMYRPQR